jgi:nucleotide-binding universal stress UspA family protein
MSVLLRHREPAVRRPPALRHLLVPLTDDDASARAVDVACRMARDHGARVLAVATIEVPLDVPLATPLPEAEERARALVESARATCDGYGVTMRGRVVRTRGAGPAIVEQARASDAELVVVAMEVRGRRRLRLGDVAEFVLRHAPCRVLVLSPGPGER